MRGMIEIKEDTYDDTIEHLKRIKSIVCKLVKGLESHSDIYDEDDYYSRKGKGRYDY